MKTIFIIFGSTGDLAKRKLFPALYSIFQNHKNNNEIDIIGVGRREFDNFTFRDFVKKQTIDFINQKKDFGNFIDTIKYSKVELSSQEDYLNLKQKIDTIKTTNSQIIFYLSISPEYFASFVDNYKQIMIKNAKVIFEKPFGIDLKSARELNNKIMEVFTEKQVWRIDHYVGKVSILNANLFLTFFKMKNIICIY